MPPKAFSRYSFSAGVENPDGQFVLTRREEMRFEQLSDNRNHLTNEGDTLFNLAGRFFEGLTVRPEGLWWVIADFQPIPIHDPTLRLVAGSVIVIPSQRFVIERVFDVGRLQEALG